jgi:hypothetical protein
MRTLQLLALLATIAVFGVTLQGCAVNVIVAPHASFSRDNVNESPAFVELLPEYDCEAGPAADVCQ